MERSVPWYSWRCLQEVYDGIFSNNPTSWEIALAEMSAWRLRKKLPIAIDATANILGVFLVDEYFSNVAAEVRGEYELRLLYSSVIIRMVNDLADTEQTGKYAKPISHLTEQINFPPEIVDVRHDAAHNDLPSIDRLRYCAVEALEYWKSKYWIPQIFKLKRLYSNSNFDMMLARCLKNLVVHVSQLMLPDLPVYKNPGKNKPKTHIKLEGYAAHKAHMPTPFGDEISEHYSDLKWENKTISQTAGRYPRLKNDIPIGRLHSICEAVQWFCDLKSVKAYNLPENEDISGGSKSFLQKDRLPGIMQASATPSHEWREWLSLTSKIFPIILKNFTKLISLDVDETWMLSFAVEALMPNFDPLLHPCVGLLLFKLVASLSVNFSTNLLAQVFSILLDLKDTLGDDTEASRASISFEETEAHNHGFYPDFFKEDDCVFFSGENHDESFYEYFRLCKKYMGKVHASIPRIFLWLQCMASPDETPASSPETGAFSKNSTSLRKNCFSSFVSSLETHEDKPLPQQSGQFPVRNPFSEKEIASIYKEKLLIISGISQAGDDASASYFLEPTLSRNESVCGSSMNQCLVSIPECYERTGMSGNNVKDLPFLPVDEQKLEKLHHHNEVFPKKCSTKGEDERYLSSLQDAHGWYGDSLEKRSFTHAKTEEFARHITHEKDHSNCITGARSSYGYPVERSSREYDRSECRSSENTVVYTPRCKSNAAGKTGKSSSLKSSIIMGKCDTEEERKAEEVKKERQQEADELQITPKRVESEEAQQATDVKKAHQKADQTADPKREQNAAQKAEKLFNPHPDSRYPPDPQNDKNLTEYEDKEAVILSSLPSIPSHNREETLSAIDSLVENKDLQPSCYPAALSAIHQLPISLPPISSRSSSAEAVSDVETNTANTVEGFRMGYSAGCEQFGAQISEESEIFLGVPNSKRLKLVITPPLQSEEAGDEQDSAAKKRDAVYSSNVVFSESSNSLRHTFSSIDKTPFDSMHTSEGSSQISNESTADSNITSHKAQTHTYYKDYMSSKQAKENSPVIHDSSQFLKTSQNHSSEVGFSHLNAKLNEEGLFSCSDHVAQHSPFPSVECRKEEGAGMSYSSDMKMSCDSSFKVVLGNTQTAKVSKSPEDSERIGPAASPSRPMRRYNPEKSSPIDSSNASVVHTLPNNLNNRNLPPPHKHGEKEFNQFFSFWSSSFGLNDRLKKENLVKIQEKLKFLGISGVSRFNGKQQTYSESYSGGKLAQSARQLLSEQPLNTWSFEGIVSRVQNLASVMEHLVVFLQGGSPDDGATAKPAEESSKKPSQEKPDSWKYSKKGIYAMNSASEEAENSTISPETSSIASTQLVPKNKLQVRAEKTPGKKHQNQRLYPKFPLSPVLFLIRNAEDNTSYFLKLRSAHHSAFRKRKDMEKLHHETFKKVAIHTHHSNQPYVDYNSLKEHQGVPGKLTSESLNQHYQGLQQSHDSPPISFSEEQATLGISEYKTNPSTFGYDSMNLELQIKLARTRLFQALVSISGDVELACYDAINRVATIDMLGFHGNHQRSSRSCVKGGSLQDFVDFKLSCIEWVVGLMLSVEIRVDSFNFLKRFLEELRFLLASGRSSLSISPIFPGSQGSRRNSGWRGASRDSLPSSREEQVIQKEKDEMRISKFLQENIFNEEIGEHVKKRSFSMLKIVGSHTNFFNNKKEKSKHGERISLAEPYVVKNRCPQWYLPGTMWCPEKWKIVKLQMNNFETTAEKGGPWIAQVLKKVIDEGARTR